jgi:ATP-dependent Lon protease
MFIATANILDTIPQPLLDRMEVLRLPGYTEEEKLHIATDHLMPRVLSNHGLKKSQVRFSDEALNTIINEYTREAGVRNLEREMSAVCRKIAKSRVSGETPDLVRSYLGPRQVFLESRDRIDRPGVATGLAWTPVGGDILFIESTSMRGRGTLSLTGQLGDVMKESAQAALSWIRTHATELGIKSDAFSKYDLHVHVPQGAIPKDGPSAGVALATALTSLLTHRVVRDDVAMTGEITLTGKVLPVGGVKEKVLAAKRAGMKVVILPERNRGDLDDLTEEARSALTFHFVTEIPQALALSIRPPGRAAGKRDRAAANKAGAASRSGKSHARR